MNTQPDKNNEALTGFAPMTLSEAHTVGGWASDIRQAVVNERERRKRGETAELLEGQVPLPAAIQKMIEHFESLGVFVPLVDDEWAPEAKVFIDDIDKLRDVDAVTLRRLLSYHKQKADADEGYWNDLAMTGQLTRILMRFENIYREVCERTLV